MNPSLAVAFPATEGAYHIGGITPDDQIGPSL